MPDCTCRHYHVPDASPPLPGSCPVHAPDRKKASLEKDMRKVRDLTLWGMGDNGRYVTTDELKDRLAKIRTIVEKRI